MPPLSYQIRALFINPHFRPPPPPNYGKIFRNVFTFMRKRFLVIILFTILTGFILGLLVTTGATLGVYEDHGIKAVFDRPTGIFWDILWWFRGQPAGFESDPDAIFPFEVAQNIEPLDWLASLIGIKPDIEGLNGPLTLWGMTTEWFVDLTIYLPKFLDVGFTATHVGMLVPFFIKFTIDIGILVVMILVMIPLSAVLAFFIPWIIMFLWKLMGPVLRIIVLTSPLWIAIIYGILSPEIAIFQFDMIIQLIRNGGLI